MKRIKKGKMVVKIVNEEIVEMMGKEGVDIDMKENEKVVIMMVGLKG